MDVGPENVVALANRMGITSELDPRPSLVLGTQQRVGRSTWRRAYSTFADNGEHVGPFVVSKVTDASGNVLYEHEAKRRQGARATRSPARSATTLNQVVEGGTGTGAKIGQPAAGKTGTTDDYRDAWFVGYTCKLTTAVWMGYPDAKRTAPKFMKSVHGKSVTGGSFPATIWQQVHGEGRRPGSTRARSRSPHAPAPSHAATHDGTALDSPGPRHRRARPRPRRPPRRRRLRRRHRPRRRRRRPTTTPRPSTPPTTRPSATTTTSHGPAQAVGVVGAAHEAPRLVVAVSTLPGVSQASGVT